MESIREIVMEALNISGLECCAPIPDSLIEEGTTYFEYTLSENYMDGDLDQNYSMQVNLVGHLVRKNMTTENTLSVLDNMLEEVKAALKGMHFKYSYKDVTMDDNIRKILVTGIVRYNEINNWLV